MDIAPSTKIADNRWHGCRQVAVRRSLLWAALLAFARWTGSRRNFQVPSGLHVEVAKVSRHVLLGVDPVGDINDIVGPAKFTFNL
jgi:hypothetical protein